MSQIINAQLLTKLISKKMGVEVIYSQRYTTAATNGKIIHLPTGEGGVFEFPELVPGYILHECGHILYTNTSSASRLLHHKGVHYGLLEDYRIEKELSKAFSGSKRVIGRLIADLRNLGKMTFPSPSELSDENLAKVHAMSFVRVHAGYPVFEQELKVQQEEMRKRFGPETLNRWLQIMMEMDSLKNTEEAAQLAGRLDELLFPKSGSPRVPEAAGDDPESGPGESGDGNGSEDKPSDTETGPGKSGDGNGTEDKPSDTESAPGESGDGNGSEDKPSDTETGTGDSGDGNGTEDKPSDTESGPGESGDGNAAEIQTSNADNIITDLSDAFPWKTEYEPEDSQSQASSASASGKGAKSGPVEYQKPSEDRDAEKIALRLQKSLMAKIDALLFAESDDSKEYSLSGKLTKPVNAVIGAYDRVFAKSDDPPDRTFDFRFVIDKSGSMNNYFGDVSRYSAASAVFLTVAKALQQADVDWHCAFFDMESHDSDKKDFLRKVLPVAEGNTDLSSAIQDAIVNAMGADVEKKVVFVVTDDAVRSAREYPKIANGYGIDLVIIAIDGNYNSDGVFSVSSPDQLEKAVFESLKEIFS